MEANVINPQTTDSKFQLELSFIEMHILMKAMSCYASKGYSTNLSDNYNESHAIAAEKFHDELTEVYTKDY